MTDQRPACSPTIGTPTPALCPTRVWRWIAFPSALALRSTDSAADRSALFVSFIATMAWSDFSPPYIAGVGSSPSRRGPLRHKANGSEMRPPRFRCDPFARDGLRPRQGVGTSHTGAAHIAFERIKTLGPCDI